MNFSENYYHILGISNRASDSEIKKSYYKLSFKHHPDKGGDERNFNTINDAYTTLMDKKSRKEYDIKSKWGSKYKEFNEFLDYEFSNDATGWDEEKLKKFKKNEALNVVCHIDDTFNGTIEYERWVICKTCKGSGKDLKSKIQIKDDKGNIKFFEPEDGCDMCEGTGKGYGDEPCSFCFGQGKIGITDCLVCQGNKRILGKQKLTKIIFPEGETEYKIEFMGNFSKDIAGKVGHLWLIKKSS